MEHSNRLFLHCPCPIAHPYFVNPLGDHLMFLIEKEIPPAPIQRPAKYPFREMEIGDSFFVVGVPMTCIHGCARRHRPRRFICRSTRENDIQGIRVWRTE